MGFLTIPSAIIGPRDLWTPAQLSPVLWLKPSDPSTLFNEVSGGSLPGVDGTVARLEDKSGNNFHATQSTLGNRPIRKVAELNGKDTLRFDGLNDRMTGLDPLANSSNFTLMSTRKGGIPFCRGRDGFGGGWSIIQYDTSLSLVTGTPTQTLNLALEDSGANYNVSGATWQSGVSLKTYVNGDLKQSASVSGVGLRSSTIGYDLGFANNFYGATDIFELVILDSVLTQNNLDKLVGYLSHEAGLASKLSSNHPYKNSPPFI